MPFLRYPSAQSCLVLSLPGSPALWAGSFTRNFSSFSRQGSLHEGFEQAPGKGGNGRHDDDVNINEMTLRQPVTVRLQAKKGLANWLTPLFVYIFPVSHGQYHQSLVLAIEGVNDPVISAPVAMHAPEDAFHRFPQGKGILREVLIDLLHDLPGPSTCRGPLRSSRASSCQVTL